jgi:hypothetical protein
VATLGHPSQLVKHVCDEAKLREIMQEKKT